jgi:hypothetical protein
MSPDASRLAAGRVDALPLCYPALAKSGPYLAYFVECVDQVPDGRAGTTRQLDLVTVARAARNASA